MYDYGSNGEKPGDIIDGRGHLITSIKKSVQLQKITFYLLNAKPGQRKSYGGGTASCFEPHLAFVYYLKEKIVSYISICLRCNRLYASIGIPAQKQGKVRKGKEVYYTSDGMSKSFENFKTAFL